MATLFRISIIFAMAAMLSGCSDYWCWPFDCTAGKSSSGVVDDSDNTSGTTPPPATTTPPATSTPGDSSGGSSTTFVPPDFKLSKVSWLHTNVSNWPVTSKLRVSISSSGRVCFSFADASKWPTTTIRHTSGTRDIQVNANPWVFAYIKGKWYGGTFEWFTPTGTCKAGKTVSGDHVKKSPMRSWDPKKGETLYFMVSALARFPGYVKHKARTDLVKVVWPKDLIDATMASTAAAFSRNGRMNRFQRR